MTFSRRNVKRSNTFMFGEHDLSDIVVVEKILRQVIPSVINQGISIGERDGRYFQRNKIESRYINVSLRFIEDSYEDVQSRVIELGKLLYSIKPQKLVLRDSELYNYAIVSQITDVEKTVYTGVCEVVFECFDPFNYGKLITFPLEGTATVVNAGSAATQGIATLTTQASNSVTITLNDGQFIKVNGPIVEGATMIVDFKNQKVTINDNLVMNKLSLESDFFSIHSGESTISVAGATGEITFTERWI